MSNKDEALRAKDLAEASMKKADFVTARRIALRAQKLDGNLENIVHMLMVCDVHCAFLEKSGDETDWYKILQVEQNADDIAIKKQYRKLALHLHPDKNKLPGAESAFKTIGEAQRVLLDKDRRRNHDMRRRPFKRPAPASATSFQPQQAPATSYTTQPVFQTNVNAARNSFAAGLRSDCQQKPLSQPTDGLSFWTSCVFCQMKCVYQRQFIRKLVTCLRCGKQYYAFETPSQSPPVQATFPVPHQGKIPTQEAGKAAQKHPKNSARIYPKKEDTSTKNSGTAAENSNGQRKKTKLSTQEAGKAAQKQPEISVRISPRKEGTRAKKSVTAAENSNGQRKENKIPTQEAGNVAQKHSENSVGVSPKKEGTRAKSLGTASESSNGQKKRKKIVESSDSSSTESSGEWEEVATGGQHSRRSVRSKHQVSYDKNKSEDDSVEEYAESAEESGFRKKSRENHLIAETLPNRIYRKKNVNEDQVESTRDSGARMAAKGSSTVSALEEEISECADPDFTNFEKSREERCFKASQTWAMYDNEGKMPRYYAMINKVIRKPSFMLKITWLEAKPDNEKAKQWVRKKLPISVGKFELRGDENTSETPSFSHLIHCRSESKNDIVSVYPRRGETWALFKNWDMNWSSGRRRSSREHEYDFDFVEILSEYAEGVAIEVAFLRKVKGFASVFCRTPPCDESSDTFQIPPHEFLRFSHRIPSAKLTGEERNGVPVGSYELDTAALPNKIEEEEAVPVLPNAAKSNQVHHLSPPSSEPDCIVIPNFQFHDFSAERIQGKFTVGQIWSFNSKEDELPKYYAKIQKVVWKPVFELQIKQLELESLPENVTQWRDKKMPVSCGNFILKDGQNETLAIVTGFSHQIKAQQHSKTKYTVLPRTGEIWAMYKNWSETIKVASLKKCDYEVVEVLDDNESHIEVMMLQRVHGYHSVFKEKVEGDNDLKKKIPRSELLRFSHFVPAFRLTGERNGALRGCVELDPTALSRNLRKS